ncbi:MAG TPA: ferrochelatase [Mariprofundaceae bacterium]|nr:ferrochelatase [Mariprofundaceae bacterium]
MPFSAQKSFDHDRPLATGILLTNLGTPDAPTTSAVRRYLKEFLSDPRVVEQPRWLWWLILNGIILNTRPSKSAHAYQKIWTVAGSPLLEVSRRQQRQLEEELRNRIEGELHVGLAMRYGEPSIRAGLEYLREKNCRRILIFPLYPQYSATTTGSTFDAVADVLRSWRRVPALRLIDGYHKHPAYIEALAASVRDYWAQHGEPERLLMSFHGIPERYFRAGDPYPCHCRKTAQLLREALGLSEERAVLTFQSRFGREPWVEPYTDATLREWGGQGIGSVDVICPGFSADCLETLEEIAIQNRDLFTASGGRQLRYIPALNDSATHIRALADVAEAQLAGWVSP